MLRLPSTIPIQFPAIGGVTTNMTVPQTPSGCFYYVDLDGFPPFPPLKSLHLSLTRISYGLIPLNLTLRLPYLLPSLKRIIYRLILPNLTLCLLYFVSPLGMTY